MAHCIKRLIKLTCIARLVQQMRQFVSSLCICHCPKVLIRDTDTLLIEQIISKGTKSSKDGRESIPKALLV